MTPPLLGVGEECQSNVTLPSSSASLKASSKNLELHERNYMMGLFGCPTIKGPAAAGVFGDCKSNLNLKATELRLGLPGSQSPDRGVDLSSGEPDEKLLFPLHPSNNSHSGNKRGFADAMNTNGASEGKFMANSDVKAMLSPRSGTNIGQKSQPGLESAGPKAPRGVEGATLQVTQEQPSSGIKESRAAGTPAPKAQVVGWPPIRSYRKNSLAATSKNVEEVDGKAGAGAVFLKVSMDGAPYLRKVDLRNYSAYQELSSSLEKMFSCFIIGQYGTNGARGKEKQGDNMPKDAMDGTDYVLTYEDKDGDWMLVGDVPWEMFLDTCRKLRIMKGSDAIGLAPRATDKCKSKN
ncbi:hypothetical protein MLD38_022389 [Melastoma candidum]|uniref:Uncharacterized protein n=1 Tax=Melastoma candidum TaxID=119954 RepID=A0ACB9QKA1_9MYRT|nr:hypothetical protein MLD38_022389 [Melastoma candidum]